MVCRLKRIVYHKVKQYRKAQYEADKQKEIQAAMEWKAAHRDDVNAGARKYQALHREEIQPKRAVYRAAHREELSARQRDYNAAHSEARKQYNKESRQKMKLEVLQHYSNLDIPCCACCGESIIEFLCIDHLNGNGNVHRKEIGSSHGRNMYRWLKQNNFPPGFQVLCWNCNTAKGLYGQCPHQREK